MKRKSQNSDGKGTSVPPILPHVNIYFIQKGLTESDAIAFYNLWNKQKWATNTGAPITNWKTSANEWIWQYRQTQKDAVYKFP